MPIVGHAPQIAAHLIVATQQLAVYHYAASEACAQRHADKILVAARVADSLQTGVHLGQHACQRLTVGEETAVVVDEYGNAEMVLKKRTERHTTAESGEIGQVAYDACLVIGRSGKGETDGFGRFGQQ